MKDGKQLIMVADDEREIRDIITLLLRGEGYLVTAVKDGQAVVEQMSEEVDLYLLDVNMPKVSGLMAASEIRTHWDTPIIFLTAYGCESDKVMGFSVGADDYIVKPFSNMEFLLRIRAILRRSSASRQPVPLTAPVVTETVSNRVPFGDLFLDLDSQSVLRGEEMISLTYTEFKILELLVTHKKKIYSLDNIYESIWEEEAVGDSAIMVHIKNIRKKIGDHSRNPVYIKTAWGKGYYVD